MMFINLVRCAIGVVAGPFMWRMTVVAHIVQLNGVRNWNVQWLQSRFHEISELNFGTMTIALMLTADRQKLLT